MKARLKKLFKSVLPLLALVAVAGFGLSLLTGDGCGPVERGLRAAIGNWDMWHTAVVAPYEEPLTATPDGAVPFGQKLSPFEQARADVAALDAKTRDTRAAATYRKFCHHCHGPNGDGRIIVGESFEFRLPDLRSDAIQSLSDERIFDSLTHGTAKMIPLAATLSPSQRILAITYLRTLADRESTPFFEPRWVEPAERPGGPDGN